MSFWPTVLVVLIGTPVALYLGAMMMIFAAAGLGNGGHESRMKAVIYGWVVFTWLLASVFGAFGLAPAWNAWHGGAQDFVGRQAAFVDWLGGVGLACAAAVVVVRAMSAMAPSQAPPSPLQRHLRSAFAIALILGSWGALIAWIAWPLVLWPVRGRFEWPDAATGWTHAAEVAGVMFVPVVIESVVRRVRKR